MGQDSDDSSRLTTLLKRRRVMKREGLTSKVGLLTKRIRELSRKHYRRSLNGI